MNHAVLKQMRAEWNQRAREDAFYYVAFGRRQQDGAEFFESGSEVVDWLLGEMRRVECEPRTCRALEIGCGPGRLMRNLARHCGEIHGVDVSDEMIRLARLHLADSPNAQVHLTTGAELSLFPAASFDFVYSYAVFQHIPAPEIVFEYLRESFRVLRQNGILTCQMNGLIGDPADVNTWHGAGVAADDLKRFIRELDCQLLTLEGAGTRYMWMTWRKRQPGWRAGLGVMSGAAVTCSGPGIPADAASTLRVELGGISGEIDLAEITARIAGQPVMPAAITPSAQNAQVSLVIPPLPDPGRVFLEIYWRGDQIGEPLSVDILPAVRRGPVLVSAADAVNYLSGRRIVSRVVKVVADECDEMACWQATMDGVPAKPPLVAMVDRHKRRFELNVLVPEFLGPGEHRLALTCGSFGLPEVTVRTGLLQSTTLFRDLPPGSTILEFENWGAGGGAHVPCTVIQAEASGRFRTLGSLVVRPGRLPFASGVFDGMMCRWDAEHGKWAEVAGEFERVLKKHSALYVEFPGEPLKAAAGLTYRGTRVLGHYRAPRGVHWIELRSRAIANYARRVAAGWLRTRFAEGGAGLYFGSLWSEPDRQPRLNVCVFCGTAHSSAQIAAAGVIVRRYRTNFYRCPACGVPNILTRDS